MPPDIVIHAASVLFIGALLPGIIIHFKGQPFGFGYLLGLMCLPAALIWSIIAENNNTGPGDRVWQREITNSFFGFTGRSGRLTSLGCYLVAAFTSLIMAMLGLALVRTSWGAIIGGQMILTAALGYSWSTIAVMIKRLHDLNLSGYFSVAIYALALLGTAGQFVLPLAALVASLAHLAAIAWLLFVPGTLGENRFGLPASAASVTNKSYLPSTAS